MVLYSDMRTAPLKTGCWFGLIPDDHVCIGISPRGLATGHRLYRKLNPGERFNSSRPAEYIKRYNAEILFKLNAQKVLQDLVHRFHETNMLGRDSHDATVYGIATPGPISQVVAWPRFGKWWNCQ